MVSKFPTNCNSECLLIQKNTVLENCGREIIGAEPFSSRNNNIMDYMIGFYNTDYGLLVTLQTLKQRLDEHRRAIPDVYNS